MIIMYSAVARFPWSPLSNLTTEFRCKETNRTRCREGLQIPPKVWKGPMEKQAVQPHRTKAETKDTILVYAYCRGQREKNGRKERFNLSYNCAQTSVLVTYRNI